MYTALLIRSVKTANPFLLSRRAITIKAAVQFISSSRDEMEKEEVYKIMNSDAGGGGWCRTGEYRTVRAVSEFLHWINVSQSCPLRTDTALRDE